MGMFADTIQTKFDEAIEKAKKERKQTMAKPMIVHTADNRIFKLKVAPAMQKSRAEVTIYELGEDSIYYCRRGYTFDVLEYDTIAEGALAMLNTYRAEVYTEDKIASKWREFENRG